MLNKSIEDFYRKKFEFLWKFLEGKSHLAEEDFYGSGKDSIEDNLSLAYAVMVVSPFLLCISLIPAIGLASILAYIFGNSLLTPMIVFFPICFVIIITLIAFIKREKIKHYQLNHSTDNVTLPQSYWHRIVNQDFVITLLLSTAISIYATLHP